MSATTSASGAGSPAGGVGFAWNPAILGDRKPVAKGLGSRPRTVPHRALLVRAAVHPTNAAKRPMVLVVGGAAVGILGWLVMTADVIEIASHQSVVQQANVYQFLLGVPAYLLGIALFSYGWQLGDRQKAVSFGVKLAVAGIVIWLIVALGAVLLVGLAGALKGGSGGSNSSSSGGSGGHGSSSGISFVGGRTFGGWGWGHPEAADDPAHVRRRCPSCGHVVDAQNSVCPDCGASLGG